MTRVAQAQLPSLVYELVNFVVAGRGVLRSERGICGGGRGCQPRGRGGGGRAHPTGRGRHCPRQLLPAQLPGRGELALWPVSLVVSGVTRRTAARQAGSSPGGAASLTEEIGSNAGFPPAANPL